MILLRGAQIITGASSRKGDLAIENGRIAGIWYEDTPHFPEAEVIDLKGKVLMAGGIDTHVHFREPGLTAKADIESESRAALLGGITSWIDMPNTVPPTTTRESLDDKLARSRGRSWGDYGFHIGATNDNAGTLASITGAAGIKVFMGSSTGGMLVQREESLQKLFSIPDREILIHSEDETIIAQNLSRARERFHDIIPFSEHSLIRSRRACIASTLKALEMAIERGTRLHILHISTAEEVQMVRAAKLHNPHITAETCAHYLWFSDEDYARLGGRLKCNPAVKTADDRSSLRRAVAEGLIDTIGSDHAPHLAAEKALPYLKCPSGMPGIQHSLPALLTIASEEHIPLETITAMMSENPARIFGIRGKGRLETGCDADLVVIDPEAEYTASPSQSKCGWSPYEGERFRGRIEQVWLHGEKVVENDRIITAAPGGKPLSFKAFTS